MNTHFFITIDDTNQIVARTYDAMMSTNTAIKMMESYSTKVSIFHYSSWDNKTTKLCSYAPKQYSRRISEQYIENIHNIYGVTRTSIDTLGFKEESMKALQLFK